MKYFTVWWCLTFYLNYVLAHVAGVELEEQMVLSDRNSASQTTANNPLTDDFREIATKVMKRFKVPGVSIAVVDDTETFHDAYGFSSLSEEEKATPDSVYYAASLTKSFTAAILMMLLEDSANSSEHLKPLQLTTKISSIIPGDFVTQDEYATSHATLEDALTHRLGFPSHEASYGGKNYTARDATRALRYLHMNSELRSTFQYFNLGYILLQHVIQTITGSWIGELHQRRIWDPLSMNNTYIRLDDALNAVKQRKADLARGYSWDLLGEELLEQPWPDSPLVGPGGIYSSTRDFAKYLRAMMDMKLPLSENAQRELVRPRIMADVLEQIPYVGIVGYALGWGVTDYKGHRLITHTGGMTGFASRLAYLPSKRWGIALMTNSDVGGSHCLDTLFYQLLDDHLGIPKEDRKDLLPIFESRDRALLERFKNSKSVLYPHVSDPPLSHALPLESYAGTYENPGYQELNFTVEKPSKRLPVADPGKPVLHAEANRLVNFTVDLEHISGEHFLAFAGTKVPSALSLNAMKAEFRVGADGKVIEVGIDGPLLAGDEMVWFRKVL